MNDFENNPEACMACGEIITPYEITQIRDLDGWYARYWCETDNRTWKIKLVSWTPVLRASWCRDNVLTREGLNSPASVLPWDEVA